MLLVSDWCYYGNMLMSGVAMETYLDLGEWGCYVNIFVSGVAMKNYVSEWGYYRNMF